MPKHKKRSQNSTNSVALQSAPRNPYTNHPLMRKGGSHEKTEKSKRATTRRETKQLVRDWSKSVNLFNIFLK